MTEIRSNMPQINKIEAFSAQKGKETKNIDTGKPPSESLPFKIFARGANQLSKNMKFLFIGIPKTMVEMCRDEDSKGNKKLSPSGIATLALGSTVFVPTILAISPILLGTALVDSAVAAIHPKGRGIQEIIGIKSQAKSNKAFYSPDSL